MKKTDFFKKKDGIFIAKKYAKFETSLFIIANFNILEIYMYYENICRKIEKKLEKRYK